jgi:hypothetical protein
MATLALARWLHETGVGWVLPSSHPAQVAVLLLMLLVVSARAARGLHGLCPRPAYGDGLLLGRAAGWALLLCWFATAGPAGTLLAGLLGLPSRVIADLFPPASDPELVAGMVLFCLFSGCGLGLLRDLLKGDVRGALFYAGAGLVVLIFVLGRLLP